MSRATDYLLHRNGRNQFGIDSDDLPGATNVEDWPRLKKEFLDQYSKQWLNLFSVLNKKQIWSLLYENEDKGIRKISLSSFYSDVRNRSINDYLDQFLLSNKDFSLRLIGISDEDRHKVIKAFNAKYWGNA
jgi:hypothetical protein